jgi:hypothetical protein
MTPGATAVTVSLGDVVETAGIEGPWELGVAAPLASSAGVNDSEPAGSDATLPVAGGVVDTSDGDCRDEEFDVGDSGAVDVSSSADATPGKAPNRPPIPSATASAPTRPTYLA